MPTAVERALQGTLEAITWQGVVDGQDTASVIRCVNVVQAQLVAQYVRDQHMDPESGLTQLAAELRTITMAMLGVRPATTEPATPSRRRK
jgi:hypothetical protein